jgi:mono/diheme cytochrome c family protein
MVLAGLMDPKSDRALMPAFEGSLSNTEIAEVVNYVTARFGAAPSRISAREVARLRAGE